jgi:type IV pilus assembly protein PilM
MDFKKIFGQGLSFLKSAQGGAEGSVVGIDIGASSIKVVQLRKKLGKAVLETYGALALGPYAGLGIGEVTNLSTEKIAEALKDVLRESSVSATVAGLSIPSSASLVFLIDIPPQVSEKDLGTIVPTEARRFIPIPISEVTIDWTKIPKKESMFEGSPDAEGMTSTQTSKTEVLVAAIHNDALARYKEVASKAGVSPNFLEIEIFSTIRSTFNRELSSVLVVDFGALKTKLSVVEYGVVRTFHVVNRGSHDISVSLASALNVPFQKAEEIKKQYGLVGNPDDKNIAEIIRLPIDYILSETSTAVLEFEKKNNKTISKVILVGGGALLKGLRERAQVHFKCDVVYGNPFAKTEAPAFLMPTLEATGPEFATALGLALRQLS